MQATIIALVVFLTCQVTDRSGYELSPQPQPAAGRNVAGVDAATPDVANARVAQPSKTTPQPTLSDEYRVTPPTSRAGDGRVTVQDSGGQSLNSSAPTGGNDLRAGLAPDAAAMQADSLRNQYGVRPSELTELLYRRAPNSELSGVPLTLHEALDGAGSRSQQTRRTLAYWSCSAAMGDYYLALREMNEIQQLASGVLNHGAEWQTAVNRVHIRIVKALQTAKTQQQQLHDELGRPGGAELPLPTDLPHSGNYDPRYDELFKGQADSAAEFLSESLPLQYEMLKLEAKQAAEAFQRLGFVSQRRIAQSDGTELLRAYETVAMRRRVFICELHDYNEAIATYAGIAAPGPASTDRVVAMLIRDSIHETLNDSSVQQASAEESTTTTSRASTLRERFQARRPIFENLRERQREHSILLNRRRRAND